MSLVITKDIIVLMVDRKYAGIVIDDIDENLVDDNGHATKRGLEIAKNAMIELAKKETNGRIEVISASGCVNVDNAEDMDLVGEISANYVDAGTVVVASGAIPFDQLDDEDTAKVVIDLDSISHETFVSSMERPDENIDYHEELTKNLINALKSADLEKGECDTIVDNCANSLLLKDKITEIKKAVC